MAERFFCAERGRGGATATMAAAAVVASLSLVGAAAPAVAQQQPAGPADLAALDQDDALIRLFEQARTGQGDPHLPFVLDRLKRALSAQDLLAFLELVDPRHFSEQFGFLSGSDRSPGAALGQFSCEFFSVCDISKNYGFNDIVSAHIVSVSPEGGLTGGLVTVQLELMMWDGVVLLAEILYDPSSARLLAAVG